MEYEESFNLSGFHLPSNPLIFFKTFFSKNMIDVRLKLSGRLIRLWTSDIN